MADRREPPKWQTSRRSSGGACVEILLGPNVLVRDSNDRDGPVLSFDRLAFKDFLDAVKRGDFDLA